MGRSDRLKRAGVDEWPMSLRWWSDLATHLVRSAGSNPAVSPRYPKGRHIMSKSKRKAKSKKPLTFIVIQGVSPKLKAGWFRKAKAKEMTFSAWAREALAAR